MSIHITQPRRMPGWPERGMKQAGYLNASAHTEEGQQHEAELVQPHSCPAASGTCSSLPMAKPSCPCPPTAPLDCLSSGAHQHPLPPKHARTKRKSAPAPHSLPPGGHSRPRALRRPPPLQPHAHTPGLRHAALPQPPPPPQPTHSPRMERPPAFPSRAAALSCLQVSPRSGRHRFPSTPQPSLTRRPPRRRLPPPPTSLRLPAVSHLCRRQPGQGLLLLPVSGGRILLLLPLLARKLSQASNRPASSASQAWSRAEEGGANQSAGGGPENEPFRRTQAKEGRQSPRWREEALWRRRRRGLEHHGQRSPQPTQGPRSS